MALEMKSMESEKKLRKLGFRHGLALGSGLLMLILAGALGFVGAREAGSPAPANTNSAAAAAAPSDNLSTAFERVARIVEPSVVNISTEQIVRNTGMPEDFGGLFGENSPFGFFFNQPKNLKQRSLGSGFVVDPRGYILTNDHVVKDATKIRVKLQDGREIPGTVVGTDPQTDLAVIKVNESNLSAVKLASADQVKVGEWVLAFGSPFGLEQTMTAGIISAKGRYIGSGNYDNFLQTDAAINPGNSGGPLVNLNGEVVGINTMILSQSGGFQGVGLAIPSTMADNVYQQLVESGKVTRGWLGVGIQEMTPELAKSFGMKTTDGVLISQVEPNSPAAKAGLRPEDIILDYNGKETKNPRDLSLAVAESKIGIPAKLKVFRDGGTRMMEVSVGEKPADRAAGRSESSDADKTEGIKLGVTVENLNHDLAEQLNLTSTTGALVTDVQSGSPADDGGVQRGDVIRGVNHKPITNVSDLQSMTRNLKNGNTVLLSVVRQGQTIYLAFDLS